MRFMSLQNQTVFIVGGTSGIGLAAAQLALAEGAQVTVASRSPEKARAALGEQVETVTLDMSQEAQVKTFFTTYAGFFDHLVVSSASPDTMPLLQEETTVARHIFDTKFWGSYYVAKYGAPKLTEHGSLTFVSGLVAFRPMDGAATMAAINAALIGFARTLALELAPRRVNVISPGITDTPAWHAMPERERRQFLSSLAQQLPVGKVGEASDLAEGILFLMKNAYTTGTVLHVEGGKELI
jgi:NAD(P)-dependent dehydrogenase (short-subunit alcohol dehydrogenase family)